MILKYAKRGSAGICGIYLLAWTAMASAASLSMEQAVNMALQNHLHIKIAANEEKQAEYTLQGTKGSRGVSIDASNKSYLKKVNDSADTSTSGITLSLPLYSGGKNEGNIKIAQTDVAIAKLNSLRTQQDVKLKTVSAYLDVIEAHQAQAVAQETVDNYLLHLKNVKAQYSAGNVAKSDVLRSEVELADTQQTLLKAQNSSEVALNNLKSLLRWKNTDVLELVEEFHDDPFTMTLDESVAYAKTHRPDVEKYRLAIQSAKQSVSVAKADQKPSVSLTAGTEWSGVLPDDDNQDTYVGITTSWNLFDNQVTKSKVKKAQSAADKAGLELEAQEDAAELAVKEYYLDMKEAEKRRETTQVAIHKAEEDSFIASAKYRVGEGTVLDVIDAQLALTTAKNNYIKAQYDYAASKAKLENAMGMN